MNSRGPRIATLVALACALGTITATCPSLRHASIEKESLAPRVALEKAMSKLYWPVSATLPEKLELYRHGVMRWNSAVAGVAEPPWFIWVSSIVLGLIPSVKMVPEVE